MQYCTLEKRGLSGDILRARNAVVILVGGSGEGRTVKVLQPYARKIGMSGLSLGAAYTLLCADGKTPEAAQCLLAKMMTMEAKYPEECNRARADSWTKLVDFFQTW